MGAEGADQAVADAFIGLLHLEAAIGDGQARLTWPSLFVPSSLRETDLERNLIMPKKRFSSKQIVIFLRQIEVLMSQGKIAPIAG